MLPTEEGAILPPMSFLGFSSLVLKLLWENGKYSMQQTTKQKEILIPLIQCTLPWNEFVLQAKPLVNQNTSKHIMSIVRQN